MQNFAELAKKGYYNGVIFYRTVAVRPRLQRPSRACGVLTHAFVLQDSMIHGGDPTGTGRGWTSIYGRKLYVFSLSLVPPLFTVRFYSEDEIHPELRFTHPGILAMANSGPGTNGV